LFRDIDKDTVDFVDNYDRTMKEPTLLPATFPSVLVNANTGIAVGMGQFHLPVQFSGGMQNNSITDKNPKHDIYSTLLAPDFPGGGQILFKKDAIKKIYETGRGSIRIRSRYRYDPDAHCIDVLEIPPTTTVEVIVEKIVDLVRQGKIKEISDIRDETGLNGLKITIDLKRGTDPDKLMLRLFKMTPLEDSFSCNFNVLINGRRA
jgi:DNA gyrase subunit A